MKWIVQKALWGLFIFFTVLGCQNEHPQSRRDSLAEGYELIDRGEYSEAILYFQKLSIKDTRPAVTVALASAYAGRGGILVSDYWGFVIGFNRPLLQTEKVTASKDVDRLRRLARQLQGGGESAELKSFHHLLEAVSLWDQYQERIEAIPVVQGAALQDLQTAIRLLQADGSPGSRLYRGILNMIVFKSYLWASQKTWKRLEVQLEQFVKDRQLDVCSFPLQEIARSIHPLFYHLGEVTADLNIAFPDEAGSLIEAKTQIQKVSQETMKALNDLQKGRVCP